MKYIVAVSGGVDSVVLLDMMSRVPNHELIVAHFDHGIRSDSAQDAAFVKSLAHSYGHSFETVREELGPKTSEAVARNRRYAFLNQLAAQHNAKIVTAHHLDDLVETVAINMTRGTGWRGLAVFDSEVLRPLVDMPKASLIEYAHRHNLAWRADSTNDSDAYLRNRVRRRADSISHQEKRELRALQATQRALKKEIETEIKELLGPGPTYNRYFLTHVNPQSAVECLRVVTKGQLTRPQLTQALLAVKTAAAGSVYEAGSGVQFRFSTRHFSL